MLIFSTPPNILSMLEKLVKLESKAEVQFDSDRRGHCDMLVNFSHTLVVDSG